ncbi:MAG: hypothetical protein KKH68_08055 [Proteobacteria bacterium]|nr:hypothetical protein [Pseudomonadota bacterium]
MKILYTSDIHAVPEHLYSMLQTAETQAVDTIIIGGDIVPHYLPDADTVGILRAQAQYLNNVFIPVLKDFKRRCQANIFMDLANDDFICNRRILEDFDPQLIRLLHLQKHPLSDQVDIIGYMIVPPTPFYRKDWEKPDCTQTPFAPGNTVALDGYISFGGTLAETVLDLSSDDTIENDLARLSESIDRPFVFVSHSPPYQTPLDVLDNGLHVGSISIRRFIEDWSRRGLLMASLHGHIHGAPDRSGAVQTIIENVLCINPGQNEQRGAALRYVILELTQHGSAPQIRIVSRPQ